MKSDTSPDSPQLQIRKEVPQGFPKLHQGWIKEHSAVDAGTIVFLIALAVLGSACSLASWH
jgi:hypothetical protein